MTGAEFFEIAPKKWKIHDAQLVYAIVKDMDRERAVQSIESIDRIRKAIKKHGRVAIIERIRAQQIDQESMTALIDLVEII